MAFYEICFSPTGGTEKVLDTLADIWENKIKIDISKYRENYAQYQFKKEDVCMIGVPSYGGRVPGIALDRLRQMQGGGACTVLVVAYGNRAYDDTLLELKNEAEACGFYIRAAVCAVAEHSIMRQFGAGRPDAADMAELHGYAEQIKRVMASREVQEAVTVPGNQPYREYGGVPFKPKAGKECIKCGKCAELCPVGAILQEKPDSAEEEKCISCMRCVAVCPLKARTINKAVLFMASKKMKKACDGRKENELFL